MAVGEHDVLAFAVDLPEFRERIVRRAADAILRVVILVRIERIEKNSSAFRPRRVAAQDKIRGKLDFSAFDGSKTAGGNERGVAAVEIIERALILRGQLRVAGAIINIGVSDGGKNLFHPTGFSASAG